ncbi:hypothetical protein P3W45_001543 [Vairimorpha bombi]|jgi:hypothetical protein
MNRNYILKISISPEESILFAELIWKKDDVLIMKNAIYMQNESVVLLSVSIDTSYVNSIVPLSDEEYINYMKTIEKAPKKNLCSDHQNTCSCKEIENAMKSNACNDFKSTEMNTSVKNEEDTSANERLKDTEVNESEDLKEESLERKIEDLTIRITDNNKEESVSKQKSLVNESKKIEDQKVRESSIKRSPKKDRSFQPDIRNTKSPEKSKPSPVKTSGSPKSISVLNWTVKDKEVSWRVDKSKKEDKDSWQTKLQYKTTDKYKGNKYDKKSATRAVSPPSKDESTNMNVLNNRGISVTFRSKKFKDLTVLMSTIKKDFTEDKEDKTWGDNSTISVTEKGKRAFLSGRGKYGNRKPI